MTFNEKRLYHQIHPIKLSIDITTEIITLYLFWFHFFWVALILHFFLPVLGSFFVIRYMNLEKQKNSPFGKYIKKYMTGFIEAIRLTGDIVMVFGAWYHQWIVLLAGAILILGGWLSGKLKN